MVVDNVHVLQFFSETNHFHCDSVYRALKDMRYKVVRIKDIKEDLSDFAGYNLSSTYKCNFLGADNKQ